MIRRVLRLVASWLMRICRFWFGIPGGTRRVQPTGAVSRALFRFREGRPWFVLVTALAYCGLLVFGHFHHELWRDEAHPWILARQAESFGDLVTGDRRYDGHPPGWFWYLRLFTFFTRDPIGLHVATIALSLGSAVLLLRFAPFARPIRLLLTFSFLFAFEYGVISRNYSLGLLFTFLFCTLQSPLRSRPFLSALCLIGLALSSVYGAIMALCFLLVLVSEGSALGAPPALPGTGQLRFEMRSLLAVASVLMAVVFSVMSSRPPDPNPYAAAVNWAAVDYSGFEVSVTRMTWATLPLRVPDDINYWGGIDYVWRDHPQAFTYAGWSLLAVMILGLAPFPLELLAFLIGAGLMAVVQMAVYPGAIRHWGHYFVLFFALAWIGRVRHPGRWGWLLPGLLFVVGLFQFESLVVALREEKHWSFSGGGETAQFIRRSALAKAPIVGGPDWAMPAVMGHLDRNFISCETEEVNQTLVFHGRRQACSPSALVQKAGAVVKETNKPVLLVTVGFASGLPPAGVSMQRMFSSRRPSASVEDFVVYRLAPSQRSGGGKGTQPEPAQSKPAQSKPAQPEAAQPEAAQPEAAQPKPAQPEPAQSKPAQSEPAQPEPAQPEPAKKD